MNLKFTLKSLCYLILFSTFLTQTLSSQTTSTITTSGSYTVPCGVTSITIQCWGGGGGGGGSNGNNNGGSGGGSGAYSSSTIAVTAGQVYSYTVGAGGTRGVNGTSWNGQAGTATTFTGAAVNINAGGGTGGGGNKGAIGTGGTATGGATNTNGNNGTLGTASGNAGGNAPNGGGTGGAGGVTNTSGNPGNNPGGGGGGGEKGGSNEQGGDGGDGRILLTFNGTTANAGPDQTPAACTTTATLAGNTAANYTGAWTCLSGCGGVTITSPTSANSTVTGLTGGSATTLQWVLTYSTGCTVAADNLTITPIVCPPANDDPTGATPLTLGATCSYTTFTNAGTTASTCGTIPAPGCSSYLGSDVWFSVVVPASGIIIFDSQTGTMTDGGMAVYSGAACGVLTLIACDDDNSANGLMPALTITGQTPGATLLVRFWEYGNDNNGTFGLCAVAGTNPCTSITNIASCGTTSISATIPSGTGTYSVSGTGCAWSTPGKELIYTFTPSSTGSYSIQQTSSFDYIDYQYKPVSSGCSSTGWTCFSAMTGSISSAGATLTSGVQYYILIDAESTAGGNVNFSILCPPTPPLNDDCTGAFTVAASSTTACATTFTATSVAATQSSVGCTGNADDDVWMQFTATATTHSVTLSPGTMNNAVMQFFTGTCAGLTSYSCVNNTSGGSDEVATLTGLTIGTTYFFRVYSNGAGGVGTFSVCINIPTPPPVNDFCAGAVAFPVVPTNGSCSTLNAQSTAGATASGVVPSGSCTSNSGTPDDDIWFTFVAPSPTVNLAATWVSGETDIYWQVFSSACSATMTSILCTDNNSGAMLTGLTVGNTYRIRMYTYYSGVITNQNICLSVPVPATNDDPCIATTATVNTTAGSCAIVTPGTIYGATASGQALGACFGTADDDVWFKFTATATSININLLNVAGSTTDLYHSVYAGTCGSLGTALICSDPNSSTVSGLTIGNVYFIRVYSYTSTGGQTTTFNLCLTTTPPPPTNVTCSQMDPICSGSPITFQAQSGGTAAPAGPNYGCLTTKPNPTWFYLQIATPGTMAVDITAGSDVDFALWGPYASLGAAQAACSSYPAPIDCSYDPSNIEQMNISSAAVGEVYALLVTNYANVIQNITLNQATGATATTNCAILPISLILFDALLNDDNMVDLNWITETELNNDYFEIQRSADAKSWETIGAKDGQGNSNSTVKYEFKDTNPLKEISYYRLKQVDFDGKQTYSKAVTINRSDDQQISNVHPNPTTGAINFDITTRSKSNIDISVINYTGDVIYEKEQSVDKGRTPLNIDLSNIPNGVYLLKVNIEKNGKTLIYKIIKN